MSYVTSISSKCSILRVSNSLYVNCIKQVLEEKGIKQVWLTKKLGESFNTIANQFGSAI